MRHIIEADRLEIDEQRVFIQQKPMHSCPNVYRLPEEEVRHSHVACWSISDGVLWLMDYVGPLHRSLDQPLRPHPLGLNFGVPRLRLRDIFDGDEGPILAHWYSGELTYLGTNGHYPRLHIQQGRLLTE
jgi:hypothetical protein